MNKVYYSIFIRGEWVEYHTSANKEDAALGQSMSHRIKTDNPHASASILRWLEDAEFYHAIKVLYTESLRK